MIAMALDAAIFNELPVQVFVSSPGRSATVRRLIHKNKNLWSGMVLLRIVAGGYQAYADSYPFIVKGGQGHTEGRLYPSQIDHDGRLDISSLSLATSRDCIEALGITAIVNCTVPELCVFEGMCP